MVLENYLTFSEWFTGNFLLFVLGCVLTALVVTLLSFLFAAIRLGPSEAFYAVAKVIAQAVPDAVRTSPRRIVAMARLAIAESMRNKVLIAFAVFIVILLFGGWFLDQKNDHPARLYISVVLAVNQLILLPALVLSAFSLPSDIKSRTIYTITTKPVRVTEIVLGRILGFGVIGTVMLLVMGGISYLFVVRGLSHQHEINAADVIQQPDGTYTGQGSFDAHHRHEFTLDKEGQGNTDVVMQHDHAVQRIEENGEVQYVMGPPRGGLEARVPHYGKLRFLDRTGRPSQTGKGISVGYEWTYRSYIDGGTLAAAIWTFDNITPEEYPDGLPLEMTLRVFRTHKGDIESGIPGTIMLKSVDPANPIQTAPQVFTVEEFAGQQIFLPRQQKADVGGELKDVDLFDDIVRDGKLEIWIRCAPRGQYYGMAQADLYLRAEDRPFAWNFFKGFLGIWLQMIIVTSFGVMFSTFLSGPVAMLATVGTYILGYFREFVAGVFSGEIQGGGPIESFIRMITGQNLMVDLEYHWLAMAVIKGVDFVIMLMVQGVALLLPDYRQFDTSEFVAYGYNIMNGLIASQLTMTAAYIIVLAMAGYFVLKTREIAA